jgi:hypothetical protein
VTTLRQSDGQTIASLDWDLGSRKSSIRVLRSSPSDNLRSVRFSNVIFKIYLNEYSLGPILSTLYDADHGGTYLWQCFNSQGCIGRGSFGEVCMVNYHFRLIFILNEDIHARKYNIVFTFKMAFNNYS